MLVRLIYASRSVTPVTQSLSDEILQAARRYNPEHGITGILCFNDSIFVQALEGSREKVNELYVRIARDERHRDLILLEYSEITERKYPSWSMARVKLDKVNLSVILKRSTGTTLDPYSMPGCATAALLEELAATAIFNGRD
ncbi:BLUF domain-containing protein [Burkholderiaceae bacterium DAT-1]|nr:BLUF domain-containing protein [Burkholderiaceae bacterium DAT-1]